MALTRVPKQLLDSAFPVRWIGNSDARLSGTDLNGRALTEEDVKFMWLQTPNEGETGANTLFVLTTVNSEVPVVDWWKEVGVGSIGDIPELQDKLDEKLDSNLSSLTPLTELSDTDIVLANNAENTAGTFTLGQLKTFVATEADKHFKGYHADKDALVAAVPNPEGGDYAVIGAYIWVWNTTTNDWTNSGTNGNVDISTQIIAGDGLIGGGDLSQNRTFSVNFGVDAKTVCEGNDKRLDKEIAWSGTEAERAEYKPDATDEAKKLTDDDIGKIFVQMEPAEEGADQTGTLWRLYSISPVKWIAIGGGATTGVSNVVVDSGELHVGESSDTIVLRNEYPDGNYMEVFLSGVRQMRSSWTLSDTDHKTITLGGNVTTDVPYDVVIYPYAEKTAA